MNTNQFWQIIDDARNEAGNWEDMFEPIVNKLSELEVSDIILWEQIFNEYQQLSYKDKLWAAAYVINGGCSDDGFDYFRGWLTAQGKDVFMNALADPESLAKVESCEEGVDFEDILMAASSAYFKKCGIKNRDYTLLDLDLEKYPLSPEIKAEMLAEIKYAKDMDIEWEEEELVTLLPTLCKSFDW